MRFTRFIPLVLAAGLLAGCAATPPADQSSAPSASVSAPAASDEITSSSQITNLDEALTFAATITPDTQSAKYEVVNTAAKLHALAADALTPEAFAAVDAQLVAIGRDATASTTEDELAAQITLLQDAVTTISAGL